MSPDGEPREYFIYMRKFLLITALLLSANASFAADDAAAKQELALTNIQRSMDIIDAVWQTSIKGSETNLYLTDTYDTMNHSVSGPSDVWPYTSAIEAHCSLLEALELVKDIAPELYTEKFDKYAHQLDVLIDNLEYYRGTYRRPSYATTSQDWSPFAVPRADARSTANVTGILNVYDDQMWLARELIRAYRITDNEAYLDEATYLIDYSLDGWDCWRDENGNEYGGITWGPGYNSKHACSNAPIIQPLVWLYDIYKNTDKTVEYYYRDENNAVTHTTRTRAEHYLDFAAKVYDWQKSNLLHTSGVYWDMMGADNTIKISRGYRQHVDCGGATGSLISYNTGTMIAGAVELFKATNDETYKTDITETSKAALNKFAKYVRKVDSYVFSTDERATGGFTTWFNDVLIRSYVDAYPYSDNSAPLNALNSTQKTLDYAFENHNRSNLLPIHLVEGWGDETVTKGFHQFSFASEYAILAVWLLTKDNDLSATTTVVADFSTEENVYNLSGVCLGSYEEVKSALPSGYYIVGNNKKFICH